MAWTIDDGSAYAQVLSYTGNAGAQSVTFDGYSDLQPDMIWQKNQGANGWHFYDSSRGVTKDLAFQGDAAEATWSGWMDSFDSDGITMKTGDSSTNYNGTSYNIWGWKINGGTTTTNNDGNVAVTLQANATAGLSIGLYEGTNTASRTFGHGLGAIPDMVIFKCRDSGNLGWVVWHHAISPGTAMYLHSTTAAYGIGGTAFGTFTTSVIELNAWGPVNGSVESFMFLAFEGVQGFSKFGTYVGNGNDFGPFVHTGFQPEIIMIKEHDGTAEWLLVDAARAGSNAAANARGNPHIYAHKITGSTYQDAHAKVDLLSNGFKLRSTDTLSNGSGDKYVYAAWAKNPFVTSGGVPATAV